MTAMSVQGVVELIQELLECAGVCLLPGCSDPDLSHPLLAFLPEASSRLAGASGFFLQPALQEVIWHESVQALCDLALQSGRLQRLRGQEDLLQRSGVQSLAALSLEGADGVLGSLLLLGEHTAQFGPGEEALLYASRSMYLRHLEQQLGAELRSPEQAPQAQPLESAQPLIKSEFVSMVGHELRTPLNIIKGYTGLLQVYGGVTNLSDQEMTPERQRHYLDMIMEQTNLLDLLVSDLLDVSRLQQGRLTLSPGPVQVEALCQQIVQLGQLRADQQGPGRYTLVCQIPEVLPPVHADADRLRQVLLNVVENAIKYSPDGGCIEVAAELCTRQSKQSLARAWVRLTVRDQGLGMPASSLGHLFRPFERLERPAIAQISGSGLGLYIAQKLVEAMGGKIEVQSRLNCGTTVSITLPVLEPQQRVPDSSLTPACSLASQHV